MTIFNPSDRKSVSGQNPQSGGDNSGIGRQVINAIFGRNPLFFNAGLGDQIAPTVDTTLYYPLLINTDFQTSVYAGGTAIFRWQPGTGKHWMVTFLNTLIPHTPYVAGLVQLLLTIPNRTNIVLTEDLVIPSATLQPQFPLIGGRLSGTDTSISPTNEPEFYEYQGIKSVYLNDQMSLIVSLGNVTVGDVLRSQIVYLELPNNQPFGPGITL